MIEFRMYFLVRKASAKVTAAAEAEIALPNGDGPPATTSTAQEIDEANPFVLTSFRSPRLDAHKNK